MDAIHRRSPLVLPKLKAKTELLQALPSLRKYFPDAAGSVLPQRGGPSRRPAAPADDSDDEEKEAARLQNELARVKRERATLLQSLAVVRAKGNQGGDLQGREISNLRISLAEKQQTLNEIRERNAELEQIVESLAMEMRDCSLLIPEADGGPAGDIAARLAATLEDHEAATKEIETRTVQYELLADRTTRDRDAAERRMRDARDLKSAAEDDMHTLSQYYYELHAAKEAAERELGLAVSHLDDTRRDWQRRLRTRRRDVKAVERRLVEEAADEAQRAQQAAEEAERMERALEEARAKEEADAAAAYSPAVLTKLQAAEVAWGKLRSAASGAATPQEIIVAWQDLRGRAHALQDLLSLTCRREDRLRVELQELRKAAAQAIATASSEVHTSTAERNASLQTSESSKPSAQDAQLRRLEALGAAAELSLKTLRDQLQAAKEANPSSWERSRLYKAKRKTNRRSSVAIAMRRSSVVPPRRISAVDLAHRHGWHGPRRGSIEIPIHPIRSTVQNDRVSVVGFIDQPRRGSFLEELPPGEDETAILSSSSDAFFPELPGLVADVAQRVEDLVAMVEMESQNVEESDSQGQKHGGKNSLNGLAAFTPTSSPGSLPIAKESQNESQGPPTVPNGDVKLFRVFTETQPAVGNAILKAPARSGGYKRGTLAGPAWISPHSPGGLSSNESSSKPSNSAAVPLCSIGEGGEPAALAASDASVSNTESSQRAIEQADKYAMEAAERYLKRLVGVPAETVAERDDPFVLESSDEEDPRPVMDRAAVKHRSHKISHTKAAKSPGAVKSQRPAGAAAGSPAGRVGIGLRGL